MVNLSSSIVKYYQRSRIVLQKVLSLTKMLYLRSTILVVIVSILFFNLEKNMSYDTASNLCLLLQKEQNVKGGEGPSGKQAVGINNGTR